MLAKVLSFIVLILSGFAAKGQEVLWASEVLEWSSESINNVTFSPENRTVQILGTPSVYPQMGESPCAWQPSGSDFGEDNIKVKFEKAISVRQVVVVENINPGAIARIFGYDETGEEYLLFQSKGEGVRLPSRFSHFIFEPMPRKLNAIRILINHGLSRGIKQYDAIAISDSNRPIEFTINRAEDELEDNKKENLGSLINSAYGEVAPIITPDGKRLYFTRLNHPDNIRDGENKEKPIQQDVWFSELNEFNQWFAPENMGSPINNSLSNAAATASSDGNSLYLLNIYRPNGEQDVGLSKTAFKNGQWTTPKEVEIEYFEALKDGDKWNTEYSISQDSKVLIMGLKRASTFGGNDLYVSFLQPNGKYSRPKGMGSVLNTADSEGTPFLSADNKTLYFSSKGHPGYGSADIFMTKRLDGSWTNWSVPINLGPQINSSSWDGFFSIPASGDYAYLSSHDNSLGAGDIFKIKLSESIKPEPLIILSGKVFETGSDLALDIPIKITSNNDSLNALTLDIALNADTKGYKIVLPAGFKYHFEIAEDGYMPLSDSLDFSNEKDYREIIKNFNLIPIRAGHKMVLENLIFDQGRFRIKNSSFDELAQLIEILNKYPAMEILLEGHTDNQGNFTLNVELAKSRVDATKKHLMEIGGIAANRISVKSWGPLKPISSNSTPETRKKNRRVEFTILKM